MMVKRYSSIESDLKEDRFLTNYRYVLAILLTVDILLSIAFIPYSIHLLSVYHKQFREDHTDSSHSLPPSSSHLLSSSSSSTSSPYSSKSFSQASLVDSIVIIIFIKLICVFFLLNDKLVPSLVLSAFQIISIFLIIVVSFHQTNGFFNFIQFALSENVLYPIIYTLFYLFLCVNIIFFAIIRKKLKTNCHYITSSV